MKKKLSLFMSFALLLSLILPYSEATAESNFTKGYTTTSGIVSERPEDIFDEPYCFYQGTGNNEGIEIWGERTEMANIPMMAEIGRELLVINKSTQYLFLEQDGNPVLSGTLSELVDDSSHIYHPNPLQIRLKPGETSRMTFTISLSNKVHDLTKNESGTFTIEQAFRVSAQTETTYDRLDSVRLVVPVNIKAYTQAYMNKDANRTAIIKGYVKTSSGKPIKDASVTISGGFVDSVTVKTNAKGYYSLKVFPSYISYKKSYHEYVITVTKNGYRNQSTVVYPKKSKTSTASFTLKKASAKLTYKLTKTIDLGIQAYSFDASANGNVIAFIPFHSGLSKEQIKNKTKLTIVSKTGKLYSQTSLPGETPYVSMTEDGEYITTVQDYGDYDIPTIYNKNGEIIYSRKIFPDVNEIWAKSNFDTKEGTIECRCVALSPDKTKIMIGTMDGEFYCIDWKTDTILWSTYLNNQIRTIDFSKNGKLMYVSSGAGYLYCLALDGTLQWKTYIGSWATGTSIGEKYIAVTTKNAFHTLSLLDAKTGKQIWCQDMASRGCGVVLSPDESCLWWGNDTSGASSAMTGVVLNTSNGSVKYIVDRGSQMGSFSSDGQYLAVKTSSRVSVYNSKTGEELFSKLVVTGDGPNTVSINFSLYLSKDADYIVVAFNKDSSERCYGQAYFFKKTN